MLIRRTGKRLKKAFKASPKVGKSTYYDFVDMKKLMRQNRQKKEIAVKKQKK